MRHRHIEDENDLTPPGIEDVITRGDMVSKERLKRRILENPNGSVADALACVVESGNEELGSYAVVWRRFLQRAREGSVYRHND